MFHMHVNIFEYTSENHLSRPVVLFLAGLRESPSQLKKKKKTVGQDWSSPGPIKLEYQHEVAGEEGVLNWALVAAKAHHVIPMCSLG